MTRSLAYYLLFFLCCFVNGYTSGDDKETLEKQKMIAISFPDPIHLQAMMYIVDLYKTKYDISIGIFDSTLYSPMDIITKYKTIHFGKFPISDEQLSILLRSSYHTTDLQDYYQDHIFEIGRRSLSDLYATTNKIIEEYNPSILLCDLYLSGIHIASLSHSLPILSFSLDLLLDFYPSESSILDSKRYFEVSLAIERYEHFITTFLYSMNTSLSYSLLYSSPLVLYSGIISLFPQIKPSFSYLLSSSSVPSSWYEIQPFSLTGFIRPSIQTTLSSFFDRSSISTHVLVYLGNNAGFESWQIKTLLGGLQDPSVNIILLGKGYSMKRHDQYNVLMITEKQVSLFYLMKSFPLSTIISYCDHLLVENALYYQIPLVCIPSLKNKRIVDILVKEQLGVSFPEGFWTESTVRDCVKQINNLHPFYSNSSKWNQMNSTDVEMIMISTNQPENHNIELYLNCVVLWMLFILFVIQLVHRIHQVIKSSNSTHVKRY